MRHPCKPERHPVTHKILFPVRKVMRQCWGLVRCGTCAKIWNRDVNGSLNILHIGSEAISGHGRPEYLKYRRTRRTPAV